MRSRCSAWLLLASGLAGTWAAATVCSAAPGEVLAGAPSELSVTVYRAPNLSTGSIDLDRLGGFALISETRAVHLPIGESRLRFEGVADGIEPASAILTGLPAGVIEKNREGALLSPSALVAAAVGKPVLLLRTNQKTGHLERLSGRILSDALGGVTFETAEGVEALRCSGLAESFSFESATDLSAHAALSVLVRSREPVTKMVTLSYLARGFDWAADYVATLSADGIKMDLGAWVTLANGNGTEFPSARTQVVAGRVNRESGEVEPIDPGGPILARCWPRGSTSDSPALLQIDQAISPGARSRATAMGQMALMAAAPAEGMVTAQQVEQEQLGDLKLYRVPSRTTVAGRQTKQVRLLERLAIPIAIVYGADLSADEPEAAARGAAAHGAPVPASRLLRTKNSSANHLGLPLPSGRVAVFAVREGETLLERESGMRDLAVDEEVEINLGSSPDVLVTVMREGVEISNARAAPIEFELRLRLQEGTRIVRADHPLLSKNGRPMFRLTIPAHATTSVRYQTRPRPG